MRIGTWNLDNKWTEKHCALISEEKCDVWLLTEVNPKAVNVKGGLAGFHWHLSKGIMTAGQYWAAFLSLKRFEGFIPHLHPASAAAVVDGIIYCSTILPWSGCKKYSPHPWEGDTLEEMTKAAIEPLENISPRSGFVWGGDWNQNLIGNWEYVGSKGKRKTLESAIKSFRLTVATADLPHQLGNGHHTIDHVAVPSQWKVTRKDRIEAKRLSTHDAYVIEVHGE